MLYNKFRKNMYCISLAKKVGTKMTIEQLQYCIAAEKNRSFSKAAEILYVSQSSISEAIQRLEDELGIQIFKRTSKGVFVTPHGEAILIHAKHIMSELQEIHSYVDKHNGKSMSEIQIGSAALFSTSIMTIIYRKIRELTPNARIKLETLTNKEIIRGVYERRLQFGLLGFRDSQKESICTELNQKKIDYDTFFESEIYCYLACDHPVARQSSVSLEELTLYPLVLHERSCADLKPILEKWNCNITEINDYEMMKQLASESPNIVLAPYIGGRQFDKAGLCRIEQDFFQKV